MNINKAIQLAAFLIKLNGGKENYTKLIKLLYLAEREAILNWGFPILFDDLYSMRNGPVVNTIMDIIRHKDINELWDKYINTIKFDVVLLDNPGEDELSLAEMQLLENIYKEHKDKNWSEMISFTHQLPEYVKVENGRKTISYFDLLNKNLDRNKYNIDEILNNLVALKKEEEILNT